MIELLRDILNAFFPKKMTPIPKKPASIPPPAPPSPFVWDTPSDAQKSAQMICAEMGLSQDLTNILVACIHQESDFNPKAVGKPNKNGTTDWGICQFNDGKNAKGVPYWIGKGAAFPSTDFVLANPESSVRLMCKLFSEGQMSQWSSYNSGAYKKYLPVQKVATT